MLPPLCASRQALGSAVDFVKYGRIYNLVQKTVFDRIGSTPDCIKMFDLTYCK